MRKLLDVRVPLIDYTLADIAILLAVFGGILLVVLIARELPPAWGRVLLRLIGFEVVG